MERNTYLWGTQGKDYCALGCSSRLENMLRCLGTTNPAAALEETKRMFFGFGVQGDFPEQEEPPVCIRYAPVYLYKKQNTALQSMKPFAAICVNGLESTGTERESYYSWLTFLHIPDLLTNPEFSALDQIFGTYYPTAAELDLYKSKKKRLDFMQAPCHITSIYDENDSKERAKDLEAAAAVLSELYKGPDHRVVIRLEKEVAFNQRSLELLKLIYSMMPSRMAVETGFSSYEKPQTMISMAENANIRIFVIPGETVIDSRSSLPDKTAVIDLGSRQFACSDPEMKEAAASWGSLTMAHRREVMSRVFTDQSSYFDRNYYLRNTSLFFKNDFFLWEKSEKNRFAASDRLDDKIREVSALYSLYRRFPVLKTFPWLMDRFTAQIPQLLAEGHTIPVLREALIRYYAKNDENAELRSKCTAYLKWLEELDGGRMTLEMILHLADEVMADGRKIRFG